MGDGHKIANLYIKRPSMDNVGLFGYTDTSAEIKNIGVTDVYIDGRYHVGGLIGQVIGSVSNSYATGIVMGARECRWAHREFWRFCNQLLCHGKCDGER